MWFQYHKQKILALENSIKEKDQKILALLGETQFLRNQNDPLKSTQEERMAALMRESLGLSIDFSTAHKDTCKPPYYLDTLDEQSRKNFVIHMESITSDPRLQTLVRYMLNVFAMKAVYGADEIQKNGQIAVIAFRTLLQEFDKLHVEFLSYTKDEEEDDFDEHGVLPE